MRLPGQPVIARANSPATRRERLLELLRSRTQADPIWRDEELAEILCCTTRTVRRYRESLRDFGLLPPQNYVRTEDTGCDADM